MSLSLTSGGWEASVWEALSVAAHPSSYSGYSPKKFSETFHLYAGKQSSIFGNNAMLFSKEGEGLNRGKIRGHAFQLQFLLHYYSTVVLKGLFLVWNFQMIVNLYAKTLFAIRPSHQQITGWTIWYYTQLKLNRITIKTSALIKNKFNQKQWQP